MTTSSAQGTYSITLPTDYLDTITVTSPTSTFYSSAYATSGATLTASTNGSYSWTQPSPTMFKSSNNNTVLSIPTGEDKVVLEESATLDVKGTVKINGVDLSERLSVIERVLGIPERDAKMEAKYPSLKKKFDDYVNTLEKYRTFERIKGDDTN